tara:strand:+ start:171 stop:374 length:204 start_codon:yes stop_codon:yes gene_type:complete
MAGAKQYRRGSNKIVKPVKVKKLSAREKLIKEAEKKGVKLRTDWSALYKKPKKVSKNKVVKSRRGRS